MDREALLGLAEKIIPERITEPLAKALIDAGYGRLTANEVNAVLASLRALAAMQGEG